MDIEQPSLTKNQQSYRRWRDRNMSTPELAKAFRAKRAKAMRVYRKQRRLDDPVWRAKQNDYQRRKYHEKVKPFKTEEFRLKLRENTRRYRKNRLEKVKRELQLVLGGKCVRCGIDDPRLLDFDHIDPLRKTMMISQELHKPMPLLLEEIKNCQLLCPNCHRLKNLENKELNAYVRKTREYRNKNRTNFSVPE